MGIESYSNSTQHSLYDNIVGAVGQNIGFGDPCRPNKRGKGSVFVL